MIFYNKLVFQWWYWISLTTSNQGNSGHIATLINLINATPLSIVGTSYHGYPYYHYHISIKYANNTGFNISAFDITTNTFIDGEVKANYISINVI